MNEWDKTPEEETVVSIDAYGIKMRSRLGIDLQPTPESWKDVLRQIRGHLLRIAVAPTSLIAEIFEGAIRLVKGITTLPSAASSRIAHGHAHADAREAKRQREVLDGDRSSSVSSPIDRINGILEKYRQRGLDAYVVLGPDETVVVVIGSPSESQEVISEAVDQFRALSAGASPEDHPKDSGSE